MFILIISKLGRGYIYQIASREILLRCDLFRKRIDPKYFFFIETNNLNVLAVRWSVKCFFTLNSPIFRIRLAEKREEEEYKQWQSVVHFTQTQKSTSVFY